MTLVPGQIPCNTKEKPQANITPNTVEKSSKILVKLNSIAHNPIAFIDGLQTGFKLKTNSHNPLYP